MKGINLYGLTLAVAMACGYLVMAKREKAFSLPADSAADVWLWAIPFALIGARLYYVAFTWELYQADPIRVLFLWEGGLAIYGGILGGALGVLILSKYKKLPLPDLADLVAPALILGQAIGRWGNFFNGEAYGPMVHNALFCRFPFAVYADGAWHMATFFYESLWNALGFFGLIRFEKRLRQKGQGFVFLWYLVYYGLGRMMIEGLRMDSLYWGNLRVSQGLSWLSVMAALLFIRWQVTHELKSPLLALSFLLVLSGVFLNIAPFSWSFPLLLAEALLLLKAFPKAINAV